MGEQQEMFTDDFLHALDDCVEIIQPKTLAKIFMDKGLWPASDLESAARVVSDCLNRNRKRKFGPEEIEIIIVEGRKRGCHTVMTYFSKVALYELPKPISPEQKITALMERLEAISHSAAQQMQGIQDEIRETLREFGVNK